LRHWQFVADAVANCKCWQWLVLGGDLDYFLEDIVQMLDFTPPPSDKKRKGGRDDDEAVDTEDKDDKEVMWFYSLFPTAF